VISIAPAEPAANHCDKQAQGLDAIKPDILRTNTSFPVADSATPLIAKKKRRQELLESDDTIVVEQQ